MSQGMKTNFDSVKCSQVTKKPSNIYLQTGKEEN